MLEYSLYHKFLRISGLTLAFVLAFQSGLFTPATSRMTSHTQSYLVSSVVGVYASVKPTELNTITAGLTAKELELAQRESALKSREIEIGLNDGASITQTKTTFVLGTMLFIILVLLVLNYALDYLRYKSQLLAQDLTTATK